MQSVMKYILKEELDETNLKIGNVFVIMRDTKNKNKTVVRGEKLFKESHNDNRSFMFDLGQSLIFDNNDGTYTRWVLSRTHFSNVIAIMYETDIIDDFNKFLKDGKEEVVSTGD